MTTLKTEAVSSFELSSTNYQSTVSFIVTIFVKAVIPSCHFKNVFFSFLISNFRHVLNVVCFLLGNSVASEFYMSTFWNTLSVPSSWAGRYEEWWVENVGVFIREKVWLKNSLSQSVGG